MIGRILQWSDADDEVYCTSRFVDKLDGPFYLADRLDPRTGERLGVSHVVFLGALSGREGADIHDDWDAYLRYNACDECTEEEQGAASRSIQ